MIGDIFRGILSGLSAPVVAQWARKYKYRTIFLAGVIGTNICLFVAGIQAKGWREAAHVMIDKAMTPLGVLLPVGIGLLAVFCVFICALGMPDKKK